MLGEKGFCKIHQVGDGLVVSVRPVGGKLKAVAGLFTFFPFAVAHFFDMAAAGGVGVIFGVRSVGDYENLRILIKPGSRPKAVPLIAFDLIERFTDSHAAAFQFHMNEWKTVDQYRYVVSGVVCALAFFVLIDDLQAVVVDILLVQQVNFFVEPLSRCRICTWSVCILRVFSTTPSLVLAMQSEKNGSHSLSENT